MTVVTASMTAWLDQGEELARRDTSLTWDVGDWWVAGEDAGYGERMKAGAQIFKGRYSIHSLRTMGYVARQVASSRRRDSLSFSIHAEVAKLTPDEQDDFLTMAEKAVAAGKTFSVRDMRDLVRKSGLAPRAGTARAEGPEGEVRQAARGAQGGV